MRRACTVLCFAILAAPTLVAGEVPQYEASYRVLYKGRHLGDAEFAVRYDEADRRYVFSSSTEARGLLKIARPNPATERSEFVVRKSGELRPLLFAYDDGSRKGEDSLRIVFDWDRGIATTRRDGGEQQTAVSPGVLDRGTLQVALMMDMAAHGPRSPYRLVDGDALERYDYRLDGKETLEVPAGAFETERYEQRREGSSRSTWIWVSPALDYLPVRIEQRRGGETRTALLLETVEWLEPRR